GLANRIKVEARLTSLSGGLRRISHEEDPSWWSRIQVVQEGDSIVFTTPTDRARAETRVQATQGPLVDGLVKEAVGNVNSDEVLVVGDPADVDPFPPLPGAREEATLVAKALRDARYDVTDLVQTGLGAILRALYRKPYRIIHLAGHGRYREGRDDAATGKDVD